MQLAVSVITPEVRGEAPLALLEGSFDRRLAKAAAYGYMGAELVVCEPEKLDPAEIRAQLARHGLAAAAVATGFLSAGYGLTLSSASEEIRSAAIRRLKELISFAAALGAAVVTVGTFRGRADAAGGTEQAERHLHRALRETEPLCLELGVRLALEPLQPDISDFLNDAQQTARFLDRGGHRAAGLLLDTYHVFLTEPDPPAAFELYRDRLIHVHLADSERRVTGDGTIDFAGVERVLRRLDYRGWQSIELARADAPDENARRTAAYLLALERS